MIRIRENWSEQYSSCDMGRQLETATHIEAETATHTLRVADEISLAPTESGLNLVYKDKDGDTQLTKLTQDGWDGLRGMLQSSLAVAPLDVAAQAANLLLPYVGKGEGSAVKIRTYNGMTLSVTSAGYREIPAATFLDLAKEALETEFSVSYLGGYSTLNSKSARFQINGLEEKLSDWLTENDATPEGEIIPLVEISTNEAGKAAAKYRTFLEYNGIVAPFAKDISVLHKGGNDWMEDIQSAEDRVLAAIKDSTAQMAFLAAQDLGHPVEALSHVCNKLHIPVKYYRDASDAIGFDFATRGEITALDVYLALVQSVQDRSEFEVENKGPQRLSRTLDIQNKVASAAFLDWTEYDAV